MQAANSTKWNIFFCLMTVFPKTALLYSYTGERSIRLSVLNSVTYDRMARPADHTNATVGFTLLLINDLDMITQQLEISGWFTVLWNDVRLTWPPENNDNTSYIHALEEEIWKPEMLIANAQSDIGLISDDHLIYRIDFLGNVEWEPVLSSVTHCEVDVTYYPFDTQECIMTLLSWGLPNTELTLLKLWDEVNMDSFLGSSVWSVEKTEVSNSLVTETLQNKTESYSQLQFTFTLKRNPGYYVFNELVPIVLSSLIMVIVTLVPVESGERLTTAFLTLVMDAVLLLMFTGNIPFIETTTSYIGFYIVFGFCLDLLWTTASVIVTRIHHRPTLKPVPRVTKGFVNILKRVTLYSDPIFPEEPEELEEPEVAVSLPTDDLKKVARDSADEYTGVDRSISIKRNSVKPEGFTEFTTSKGITLPPIQTNLTKHQTIDKLNSVHMKSTSGIKAKSNDVIMSWVVVASVVDRVLFFIFFVIKVSYNAVFITRITNSEPI